MLIQNWREDSVQGKHKDEFCPQKLCKNPRCVEVHAMPASGGQRQAGPWNFIASQSGRIMSLRPVRCLSQTSRKGR